MAKIHIILNSKNTIGKSYVASVFAQYKKHHGQNPLCLDTDLLNPSLLKYKLLNAQQFDIGTYDEPNQCNFNCLVERIPMIHDDVIIDISPNAFNAMSHYLGDEKAIESFSKTGHEFIMHTVIAGGEHLIDTLTGSSWLINQKPKNALFVVWLNPYYELIEDGGKGFDQMKVYTENKHRITSVIQMPALNKQTFGYDLKNMLTDGLTFDEGITCPSRFIVTRQRLKMIRDGLYRQIDAAAVL